MESKHEQSCKVVFRTKVYKMTIVFPEGCSDVECYEHKTGTSSHPLPFEMRIRYLLVTCTTNWIFTIYEFEIGTMQ